MFERRSLAHVLGQTVGRTFQATCDAALGDACCGVDLEDPAFKGTGGVIDLLQIVGLLILSVGGLDDRLFDHVFKIRLFLWLLAHKVVPQALTARHCSEVAQKIRCRLHLLKLAVELARATPYHQVRSLAC